MCTEDLVVAQDGFGHDADTFPSALVVGPYAFSRDGIKLHLQNDGIPVVGEYAEMGQVLVAVQEQRPGLIFFEVFEDGSETFDFIVDLKVMHPQIQIGVFVHKPTVDHLIRALRTGVSAFITKGSPTLGSLRAIAREMLRGGLVVDPQLLAQFISEFPWSPLQPTTIDRRLLSRLSERDREIVSLLAQGASAPLIGETLSASSGTIRNRLTKIYQVIGVSSRSEAAAFAVRCGLVS